MSNYSVSSRYAKALLEIAREKSIFEKVSGDSADIYQTFKASRELRNIMASPVLSSEKKLSIVDSIFKDKVSPESLNFLGFIIRKKRETLVTGIYERFLALRDEELQIVNAEVYSASELNEMLKKELISKIEKYTGMKSRTSFAVRSDLVGGFVIKIGDKVLDASVTNQLKVIKKKLIHEVIL